MSPDKVSFCLEIKLRMTVNRRQVARCSSRPSTNPILKWVVGTSRFENIKYYLFDSNAIPIVKNPDYVDNLASSTLRLIFGRFAGANLIKIDKQIGSSVAQLVATLVPKLRARVQFQPQQYNILLSSSTPTDGIKLQSLSEFIT